MKKIILLIFLVSYSLASEKTDSLEIVLSNVSRIERVEILNRICEEISYSNPGKCVKYANEILTIISGQVDSTKYGKQKADALLSLGQAHYYLGEYNSAYSHVIHAQQFFLSANDTVKLIDTYILLGNTLLVRGLLSDAVELHHKAKELSERTGDKFRLGKSLNNIAIIYKKMRLYEKAIEYYLKSKDYFMEVGQKRYVAIVSHNIANIYGELKKHEESFEYFKEALATAQQIDDLYLMASCLTNMGLNMSEMGQPQEALKYIQQGSEVLKKFENKKMQSFNLTSFGDVYYKQKRYKSALNYYKKALIIADEANLIETSIDTHFQLSGIYKELNNLSQALFHLNKYIELKNKVLNTETVAQIANIQKNYEIRQNQRQIKALENENQIRELNLKSEQESKRLMTISTVLLFFLLLTIIYFYWQQKLQKNQLSRKNAELEEAINKIKTLSGLLPICSSCKKIRDDKGYWNQIEVYIEKHSDAEFSHSLCEECVDKLYGDQDWYRKQKKS